MSCNLLFFLLTFIFLLCSVAGQLLDFNCDKTSNYSANSVYQSNLDQLLSNLAVNGSRTGFLSDTVGEIPNQAYGLALCRGDTDPSLCISCITTAHQDALQNCSGNKGSTFWYGRCLLRFSYQNFLSSPDIGPSITLYNGNNVTDVPRFEATVPEFLSNITSLAAFKTTKKFATGEVSFTAEIPTIYGLVQCTPDWNGSKCQQCLQDLFNPFPDAMVGKQGGRVIAVRCSFQFEVYKFFDGKSTLNFRPPSMSPPMENPTTPPPSAGEGEGKKGNTRVLIIVIVVVAILVALLLMSITCIYSMKRKRARKSQYQKDPDEMRSLRSITFFDLPTLQIATAFFSEANKLGEGGFGAVYKGILHDGSHIAVKKLLGSSGEGFKELINEFLVAKLQHRNLVKLLGVCFEEDQKLLVYEHVANGSLEKILFDHPINEQLNWEVRYKIITGVAQGLLYLHEESRLRIIHRDIKASNILLDPSMNPKITDFGIAKLFDGDQTQGKTRRAAGTHGYMAPEYVIHGYYSVKSDIFSFGILVLEILTGRKRRGSLSSEHDEDFLSFIWERWNRRAISEILDPSSGDDWPTSEVSRCIQIGLLCIQDNPSDRPNISRIVLMLSSSSMSLPAPSPPSFLVGTDIGANPMLVSQNVVTISELEAR